MMHATLATMFVLSVSALDSMFETGFDAYQNGNYEAAAKSFETLVAEGVVEAEVFFNLGNAYYRMGDVGPAIANYERALQLQPGLLVARENLVRAVNATERRLSKPRPPAWEQAILFWHGGLSPNLVFWAAAGAWFLAWTLLALRRFKRVPFLRRAATVLFLVAAAFAASFYAKTHPQQLAVANEKRVPVHYGTSTEETVRFELYEGDRVLVDAQEEGWARVVTADGERGWAPIAQLSLVGPPYPPGPAATTDEMAQTP